MSRSSALILLGLLIMLAPVSGLPSALRTLLVFLFGACVLIIGIVMRAEKARKAKEAAPVAPVAPAAAPPASAAAPVMPAPPPVPPKNISPI